MSTITTAIPHHPGIEKTRDHLVKNCETLNPGISPEVEDLVQRIGQESASEKRNLIIRNLIEEQYSKKTLPIWFLTVHLREAGSSKLADEIAQRNFRDPGLNRPTGITERHYRLHRPSSRYQPYTDD